MEKIMLTVILTWMFLGLLALVAKIQISPKHKEIFNSADWLQKCAGVMLFCSIGVFQWKQLFELETENG